MFGGERTAQVPCHGMVFGILPSNFQSLHFSSKQEWERAALQVNFGAHDLSLSDKPDASGQISEFKWWPRSLRCRSPWKSSSRLMNGKLKGVECSACPFYDTQEPLQVVRVAQEPCYWHVNRICVTGPGGCVTMTQFTAWCPLWAGENIWVLWWDSCLASSHGNRYQRGKLLCKQSANQMQKMGIRAGFSSKPQYCLILNC